MAATWSSPSWPTRTPPATSISPRATYDLEIRPAGTTDVAFDIDPLDLAGGNSFTVFAIGSLADGTFTVLPAVDASLMMDEEMAEGDEMAAESPEASE